MKTCDVAVLGLGIMGSAALYNLRKNGVDALGFDPLLPGEQRGSSHGSCRIYRRFNFEGPAYTKLSDDAAAAWAALETACGEQLLLPCPVVEAGEPGSALVAGSRQAAGRADNQTTGADVNARFDAFALPRHWDAVIQDSGGILRADRALQRFREAAGDRVIRQAARFAATPSGIVITTADGTAFSARKIIVAAGPWVSAHVPALADIITLSRQPVGWFAPIEPAKVRTGAFPIFLLDGPHGVVYGFPDFEGKGVKAALHDHGARLEDADAVRQDATDEDVLPVAKTLAACIPAAAGPLLHKEICVYSNTKGGDVEGSPAEEFIVDRLPTDPRVIVASPCSGHGFKFASAIGEMLADMAMYDAPSGYPEFSLNRFSQFTWR
jgi:sarcosine oxidase